VRKAGRFYEVSRAFRMDLEGSKRHNEKKLLAGGGATDGICSFEPAKSSTGTSKGGWGALELNRGREIGLEAARRLAHSGEPGVGGRELAVQRCDV
jgi:hypothetical protein